jgi:tripartite-type tricarboxylate transporter receptor subunit TctC
MLETTSLVLAVHKNFPVNSLQEFIAYVKARPGQLNYGSPGNGTHHHLCMELLKIQAGLNIVHIPYKGSAGAENDLIAGIIPAMFLPIHVALAKMRAGQIKVLGSSLKERHPLSKKYPLYTSKASRDTMLTFGWVFGGLQVYLAHC